MNLNYLIRNFQIEINQIKMILRIFDQIQQYYFPMGHTLLRNLHCHNSLIQFHYPPHFIHFNLYFILQYSILQLILILQLKLIFLLNFFGLILPILIDFYLKIYQFSIQTSLNRYLIIYYFQSKSFLFLEFLLLEVFLFFFFVFQYRQ